MSKPDLRFFSQRIGEMPSSFELQLYETNDRLRNAVWDILYSNIISVSQGHDAIISVRTKELYRFLWVDLLGLEIDKLHWMSVDDVAEHLKVLVTNGEWHEIYSIIDGVIQGILLINTDWWYGTQYVRIRDNRDAQKQFVTQINRVLERYNSGYRIIDNKVMPISDKYEVAEVESALKSSLNGVRIHINAAAAALSDNNNPDYRACIREAITAVEAICREITGESTLDRALKSLSSKVPIQSQFKIALEKLYHYTNDGSTGIRHALMDDSNTPDFADAKYMLVVCAAFINYLTYKKKFSSN